MCDLDKIEICPVCGRETTWGSMVWLEGLCTCPECYKIRRAELDEQMQLKREKLDEQDD